MSTELFAAIERHGVPLDPLLRRILERVEVDDKFREDLDACNFQPCPMPSDEIDCLNPWLFIIAMNGGGSAYGLYLHPRAIMTGVAPWVYFEHENGCLYYLTSTTPDFFRGLVADTLGWSDELEPIERVRTTLIELGVDMEVEPEVFDIDADPQHDWIPPHEPSDLSSYLAHLDSEPWSAELGLLAHCVKHDPKARGALDALYQRLGYRPPRDYG